MFTVNFYYEEITRNNITFLLNQSDIYCHLRNLLWEIPDHVLQDSFYLINKCNCNLSPQCSIKSFNIGKETAEQFLACVNGSTGGLLLSP